MKKDFRIIQVLAISGSLRTTSSNTALLRAAAMLAPESVDISLYTDLGNLPHFNPDLEGAEPLSVKNFWAKVQAADGILISSPEYGHGVPGVMKNALDWLVGGEEFIGKPVALLNASPRATHAQASLIETITVMSGRIVSEASITVPLLGKSLDEAGIVSHPEIARMLQAAMLEFARAIESYAEVAE